MGEQAEVPGVGTVTVQEASTAEIKAAAAAAERLGCRGCGASSADYRTVPDGVAQLGGKYPNWFVESCPLCQAKGRA